MKKIIGKILLIVILFNFIFCNKSYCEESEGFTVKAVLNVMSDSTTMESAINNSSEESSGEASLNVVTTLLFGIFNIIPMLIRLVMMCIVGDDVSIQSIVFNKVEFFDVNYFDFSRGLSASTIELKKSVSKYFIMFRFISVGLELVVLIYIGIRIALSTFAEQKAKYKKMLIGWVESLIILFTLQYVLGALFAVSDFLTNICLNLKNALDPNDTQNFEQIVLDSVTPFLGTAKGFNYVSYSFIYWFMTFIQVKFYITFIKRVISTGFLILISPFISVIYSIDKAGDGRAQSFEIWLKEIIINVLIQPIYAFVYLIFILTAGEICEYSLIFSAMLLLIMTKIERFIFKIFNLSPQSIQGVRDQKVGKRNI